jgi:Skp family chaperone for outer membrane proteins
MRFSKSAALLLVGAAVLIPLVPMARAEDYFVPNQPQAQPQVRQPAKPKAAPKPQPQAQVPVQIPPPANLAAPAGDAGQISVQLPPVPELPPLPKGASPPAAVIGVIGVLDVLRGSAAAQKVEKTLGERRAKLNEDAQKEQAAWRDLQQALASQRGTLSAEQVRTREQQLQDRITNAQKQFRDRNRIIQEAEQVGLGQIERTLASVIRQVADSHGMNLVLHKTQVALNMNEFDITDQVAQQLNKILPSVTVPPDGVSPVAQQQVTPPRGAPDQGGTTATPVAAPADAAKATAAPGQTQP